MRPRRRETGDDRAVAADIVDVGDALTTAAGAAIFISRRQLAIAIGADGEDELLAPCQLGEALLRHRRRAVLLRLPRGEAQIILALLLAAHAPALADQQRDHLVPVLRTPPAPPRGR